MLEKDRFLEIKKLAQDIRRENEGLFKAFKMESPEDAIKEKEEFIETIIDNLEGNFSEGENGKEEKQIFRANILIPDDEEFLDTYSRDKNIRNLMNTYSVSIEDVMSKITELNIYADYIASAKTKQPEYTQTTEYTSPVYSQPKESIKEEANDDFVDTMVNLSTSDASSLLDEIENLSNVMAEFNISDDSNNFDSNSNVNLEESKFNDIKIPTDIDLENEIAIEEEPKSKENLDYSSDMSIDDISEAVDGFVDDYNSIQVDLDKLKQELRNASEVTEEQKNQIRSLREEAYSLRKNNLESVKSLKEARKENEVLENENSELKRQVAVLEEQIKRASALLKKIYNSIPRR